MRQALVWGVSGIRGFRQRWWRRAKRRRRLKRSTRCNILYQLFKYSKTISTYSDAIFRARRSDTSCQNSTTPYRWPSNFVVVCHHIKMAPIFAAPDIASIVAAFPPPEPTKGQASLVRSTSGEKLYNSQNVLARFESLLEASKDRISISNLASILGIRDADWLLAPYHGPLSYSQDGRMLIPNIELRRILDSLVEATDQGFVDTLNWSAKHDIHKD